MQPVQVALHPTLIESALIAVGVAQPETGKAQADQRHDLGCGPGAHHFTLRLRLRVLFSIRWSFVGTLLKAGQCSSRFSVLNSRRMSMSTARWASDCETLSSGSRLITQFAF